MPAVTVHAHVRTVNHGISVIDVYGDVTAAAEKALMNAYAQASRGNRRVVLNLSGTRWIDGSGLASLVVLLTHASRRGEPLLACGASSYHQDIFALTRLDQEIAIFGSESEAVAAGGGRPEAMHVESTPGVAAPPEVTHSANWASPVTELRVKASQLPAGTVGLNVDGRQVVLPLRGFGQLWRKTYSVRLAASAVTPAEVMRIWKGNFASFWPKGNTYRGSPSGIAPGDVAVLDLALLPGVRLYTGVLVAYADETSFTFVTLEGHMYAGLITFSAYADDSLTVAQVQPLIRAGDPLYELGLRFGIGHRIEDSFWHQTLKNLAAHFGAQGDVNQTNTLLDSKVRWSAVTNDWNNAAVRTILHRLTAPLHRRRRPSSR